MPGEADITPVQAILQGDLEAAAKAKLELLAMPRSSIRVNRICCVRDHAAFQITALRARGQHMLAQVEQAERALLVFNTTTNTRSEGEVSDLVAALA